MKHLDHYISPKTGKRLPLAPGKGYARGCRCDPCRNEYNAKKRAQREARRNKPIPADIHGTWNGYTNYGCRCSECLQACRDTTYAYYAEYRELNRDRINAHRRDYYYDVKAAQLEQDRRRKLNG